MKTFEEHLKAFIDMAKMLNGTCLTKRSNYAKIELPNRYVEIIEHQPGEVEIRTTDK